MGVETLNDDIIFDPNFERPSVGVCKGQGVLWSDGEQEVLWTKEELDALLPEIKDNAELKDLFSKDGEEEITS